ncbi:double homeobox protein 4-like protein 4 [Eubalaena glacialis]|uniref:double homeobox protein 4-like protein 4 n=1 Tax=Eubalaena glacialis TaxID=27606 RepID=UPI002A5A0249|nr:double homeobox protein 4-like protein 4 [Eubalaena glacialis]
MTLVPGKGNSSSEEYRAVVGRLSRPSRRRRLVLRLSQKDTLQALFQQNPYPGITTRERLARELGIPESRIQVWFQNQRRRRLKQSRLLSENAFKGGQSQPLRPPPPQTLTRGAASGCCVGHPLMFIVVQPSLAALQGCQNPQPLPATVPWGEGTHAVIASGQPAQGAILPPAPPETHFWQQQATSSEETSPQLEQQTQHSALLGSSSRLDELLSDADILDKAGPLPNADAEEEELAATLEAPLSEEEFQALLDMLPGSPVPQA